MSCWNALCSVVSVGFCGGTVVSCWFEGKGVWEPGVSVGVGRCAYPEPDASACLCMSSHDCWVIREVEVFGKKLAAGSIGEKVSVRTLGDAAEEGVSIRAKRSARRR